MQRLELSQRISLCKCLDLCAGLMHLRMEIMSRVCGATQTNRNSDDVRVW